MIYDIQSLIAFCQFWGPLIGIILLIAVYVDDQFDRDTPEERAYRARIQHIINNLQEDMKNDYLSDRSEQEHGLGTVSKWRHNNWYSAF